MRIKIKKCININKEKLLLKYELTIYDKYLQKS